MSARPTLLVRPAVVSLLLVAALLAACAGPARRGRTRPGEAAPPTPVEPLRLEEVAGAGDATRRASTRLVLQGLDADAAARPQEALRLYERSLQVDATNPWAYLALARYHAEEGTASLTLSYLDKAQALLGAQRARTPGVEPHLVGLRGEALLAAGRSAEAAPLLERARFLSPSVWADGHLSPSELR